MSKTVISEGKTSTEAIEKGLKMLNTTKNNVEIKILEEEDKRSFFSILAPRVVKVELTVKDEKLVNNNPKRETRSVKPERKEFVQRQEYFEREVSKESLEIAKNNIEIFIEGLFEKLQIKDTQKEIEIENNGVNVKINGEDTSFLIGYRGETLNAFQTVISSVANSNLEERCKVLIDIQGYRKKREKTLEELAEKVAKTVVKNKKSITLEPMSAYERKVIHSKIQGNNRVKTYSVGEEPYRKVVIALK